MIIKKDFGSFERADSLVQLVLIGEQATFLLLVNLEHPNCPETASTAYKLN